MTNTRTPLLLTQSRVNNDKVVYPTPEENAEIVSLKRRIAELEQRLLEKDNQLLEKDNQLLSKDQEIAEEKSINLELAKQLIENSKSS